MTITGQLIKEKRKENNYSQWDIANKFKIHAQFVSDWERGRCLPPMKRLKKLCSILKTDPDLLRTSLVCDYMVKLNKALG